MTLFLKNKHPANLKAADVSDVNAWVKIPPVAASICLKQKPLSNMRKNRRVGEAQPINAHHPAASCPCVNIIKHPSAFTSTVNRLIHRPFGYPQFPCDLCLGDACIHQPDFYFCCMGSFHLLFSFKNLTCMVKSALRFASKMGFKILIGGVVNMKTGERYQLIKHYFPYLTAIFIRNMVDNKQFKKPPDRIYTVFRV